MRRYRKWKSRRRFFDGSLIRITGIIIAAFGVIIIIQVIPIRAWLFILGLLFILLGWFLYKIC